MKKLITILTALSFLIPTTTFAASTIWQNNGTTTIPILSNGVYPSLTISTTSTSTFLGAIISTCFATSTGQPCITGGSGGSFSTTSINNLATTTFNFTTSYTGTGFTISTTTSGVQFNLSTSTLGFPVPTNYFTNSSATTSLSTGSILTALTGTFGTVNATNTSATNYFGGNVGIGTTSPTNKLQVLATSSGVENYSFTVWPTTATRNDLDITVGYQFVVPTSITVNQLGRLYVSGNTNNHQIGIWNYATGALVTSGTILVASTSDSNGFKWVQVTPVTLSPSNIYVIGILENASGDTWKTSWDTTNIMNQFIKRTAVAYALGSSLTKPVIQATGVNIYDTPAMGFTTASDPQIVASYDANNSIGINSRSTGDAVLMLQKNDQNVSFLSGVAIGHSSLAANTTLDVLGPTSIVSDGTILTLNSTDGTNPFLIGVSGGSIGGANTLRYTNLYTVLNGGSNSLLLNYDSPTTNVGIGNIIPQSKFDVQGNMSLGSYAGVNAAPSNGLIVSGNVGIGTTAPNTKLEVVGTASSTGLQVNGYSTTTATSTLSGIKLTNLTNTILAVDSSGNVIATTSAGGGASSVGASGLVQIASTTSGSFASNALFQVSTSTWQLTANSFNGASSTATSSFAGSVTVGSTTASTTFSIDQYGHVMTGGTAPTCGTGCSSVTGDDNNMAVVTGSSVSSATVNFASTWKNAAGTSITPVCHADEESAGVVATNASSTPTTVVLEFASALTTKVIGVSCQGSFNFTN